MINFLINIWRFRRELWNFKSNNSKHNINLLYRSFQITAKRFQKSNSEYYIQLGIDIDHWSNILVKSMKFEEYAKEKQKEKKVPALKNFYAIEKAFEDYKFEYFKKNYKKWKM